MDMETMQKLGNTLDEILEQAVCGVGRTYGLPETTVECIRVEVKTRLILELINNYKVSCKGD